MFLYILKLDFRVILNRLFLLSFLSFFSLTDIKFDRIVEDAEWSDAEVYDLPFEISYNTEAEHDTLVYIKNDSNNLYVAFKALGNREFIRAGIRARDGGTGWMTSCHWNRYFW